MTSAEDRPGLPAPKRIPYGLVSLYEMFNVNIFNLCGLRVTLLGQNIQHMFTPNANLENGLVHDGRKQTINKWLGTTLRYAEKFDWQAVKDRVESTKGKLDGSITYQTLIHELTVLQETMDSALQREYMYRYPRESAALLVNCQRDWSLTLQRFPSAQLDVTACVDCWAMEQSTASVFHAMRVLEHGIRALAKDLNKSFDTQNWQVIIEQIEAEIRDLGRKMPGGAVKSARLQFLSEAAKEFMYFKDAWRNYVSHGRGVYDTHQARSVMEHVRAFMNGLASELHE